MNRSILVPAVAVLALLAPAAARAQGYHWLQQSWHLKSLYLNGRITTLAHSCKGRPEFLKEADRVIGLMDSEESRELVKRYRVYMVARDGANLDLPWDEYRLEMIKAMSAVAAAAANTPSQAVFFARFDDLIFVNIRPQNRP